MWQRIALHFAFWAFYLLTFTYLNGYYEGDYGRALLTQLLYLPIRLPAVYLILYVLIPRYVKTRRWSELALVFLLFCSAIVLLNRAWIGCLVHPLLYADAYTFNFWSPYSIANNLFSVMQIAGTASAFKLLRLWYQARERSQRLQQEKLEKELNFLRAQIHPHFLFNTLNNIYALSLKSSPQTPKVVMKLSQLLRFMLYEAHAGSIPLKKEVQLLEDYLDLERIRYNQRLSIHFEQDLENPDTPFPPMLLLPLVENAFKHGIDQTLGPALVRLHLQQKGPQLQFSLENSKDPEQTKGPDGIGLGNTRRQLELLYPDQHRFTMEDRGKTFFVHLHINLNHG